MLLPPMTSDEALAFVQEVLEQFRLDGENPVDAYFPFTERACRTIIEEVKSRGELKPRSVMQAFSAVLESADLQIESHAIANVQPDFAKRVLASYTFVSKDEETDE